ncbi:uncharacterized protein ACO6RY_15811 [Pungitius sinensis]
MVPLWLTSVFVVQTSGMLSHVEKYEVVRPQRSLQDPQLHPDSVEYELMIEGTKHTILLEKNRNLLVRSFSETRYAEDGKRVTTSTKEELCFYHGHVRGLQDSSVSVDICSGISGFLRLQQQVFLIEPLGRAADGDHALYRRENLKLAGPSACGSSPNGTAQSDRHQDSGPGLSGLFRSRSWKTKAIGGPQRFVELFVVVDNAEYKRYGDQTKSRVLGVINHVDKLYRPLNIRVVLVGLEIWTDRDHIDVDVDPETTLDNFLKWRRADLLRRVDHDNAQLVTGKDFDGDTVGLANKFAMCTENSGGVNQDHHDNPIGLASTIAHEMGHNFGLSHDSPACLCGPSHSSGTCVMAEKLRSGSQMFPELFSRCSVEQLADFTERARPGCLRPPGSARGAGGPRCGDALLDPGEQCDCGTVEECKDRCCDASTCLLAAGSQCAQGQCCHHCQLKPAGSVCREAAGGCDLPEFCTGASWDCPEDAFQMNGTPCFDQGGGFCHSGRCPTHQQHCWRLFGNGASLGSHACFELNRRGEEGANCGRNGSGYVPCAAPNVLCGSMFCGGGGESITGKMAVYTVHGIQCKLAVDDDGTRNLDMVPRGTRCGTNKVCMERRCVDVSLYGSPEDCSKKCSSNGVCNHKEECHCDPGWAPPHCDVQYADLSQGRSGVVAGVCAAVSILLIISGITAGLLCCKKDHMDNYSFKRTLHSAPDRPDQVFQEQGVKDRPQISSPTFLASTATQACAPLMVSAPPPQMKPVPQSKPLPALSKTGQIKQHLHSMTE